MTNGLSTAVLHCIGLDSNVTNLRVYNGKLTQ
jgi:hypothetical protein